MKYKPAMAIVVSLVIGGILGFNADKMLSESTDEATAFYTFKIHGETILSQGTDDAKMEYLKSWLEYIDSHNPIYSAVFSHTHAKNIERAIAYYRMHEIEDGRRNVEASKDYLDKALDACAKFSKEGACTALMVARLACVLNTETTASSCP